MSRLPGNHQPLSATELSKIISGPRAVAIHCWASWNVYDYQLAERLATAIERFRRTVDLYSLDVEDVVYTELVIQWNIVNVPAIVVLHQPAIQEVLCMENETLEQFLIRVENCLTKVVGRANSEINAF